MKQHPRRIWGIFLCSTLLQFFGSLLYYVWYKEASHVHVVYTLTKGSMVVLPGMLLLLGFSLPKLAPGDRWKQSVRLGLSTGFGIGALIWGIYLLFTEALIPYAPNIAKKVHDFGLDSLWVYVIAGLAIALVHSGFEELFWRWYVVRGLEHRLTSWKAIVVGNALFALHHVVILWQFFPWYAALFFGFFVGVGGGIWSMVYKKTGSLTGAWISHATVDVVIFAVGYVLIRGV